jgi:hypothetical protein
MGKEWSKPETKSQKKQRESEEIDDIVTGQQVRDDLDRGDRR